ncbi:MAG: ABC transporter permease [Pseudopedobacter saltans]|uniref:ABC transporter permease n=1 Tax=Pseudopedobacter saltans TaxID=151895 RepID=A0A2W5F1C9_9SPHI|nr:MAG: ABC transporter permease [Pseudopedobacter saltans]
MFKNYFKTAIRSLLRNKGYAALNIFGLAIGMASAILIVLWIVNEVSTDRFYKDVDRIYILNNRDKAHNGEVMLWSWTPKVMGPIVKNDFPEVENTTRVSNASFLFTVGENKAVLDGISADSSFLDIFSFPIVAGKKTNVLSSVNDIVLTEKTTKQLFGKDDPIGKTVKVDSTDLFTVSAVLKALPANSSFKFDFIVPISYLKKLGQVDDFWGNNTGQTFVKLRSSASLSSFNTKIKNLTINHSKESGRPLTQEVFAYPLTQKYLNNKVENGQYVSGRGVMVKLFTVIACLILLIACINFMNLSTARSEKRAKEVGVRKVVGARRGSLIAQFIMESVELSFVSFTIAILIVFISLPYFNKLVGKELILPILNITFWLLSIAFILFTGILAGSYPAFFLSSFKPVSVLKGTFRKPHYKVSPRSVLVVVQFTFAIVLIISTLVIADQIHYLQKRDKGYNQDALVYSFIVGDMEKNYNVLKQDMMNSGAVTSVTKTLSPITENWSNGSGYSWTGSVPDDKKLSFVRFSADADLIKTVGFKLIQGRDIDVYKYPTDSSAVVLNETAVKEMHLSNPIGATITNSDFNWHVVGVVKDFIIDAPSAKIEPMMIQGPSAWFGCVHYRLNPDHATASNLEKIESIFKKYNSAYPFEYNFVDENYAKKFENIQRIGWLTNLFGGLTIFISCLGLFGLAAYMAEARTKEIGVRKVLGASAKNLCGLLTKDFLKLVAVSILVASPIAWYAMRSWLENYTFRINIPMWTFFLSGGISLVIAFLTVGFLALRAAGANPTKSLRTE